MSGSTKMLGTKTPTSRTTMISTGSVRMSGELSNGHDNMGVYTEVINLDPIDGDWAGRRKKALGKCKSHLLFHFHSFIHIMSLINLGVGLMKVYSQCCMSKTSCINPGVASVKNVRGEPHLIIIIHFWFRSRSFHLPTSDCDFYRYIRIDFHSHYYHHGDAALLHVIKPVSRGNGYWFRRVRVRVGSWSRHPRVICADH